MSTLIEEFWIISKEKIPYIHFYKDMSMENSFHYKIVNLDLFQSLLEVFYYSVFSR
jgi:hypothetical protein